MPGKSTSHGAFCAYFGGRHRQHPPPRGIRLGHPEAEEGQGRFREDGAAELGGHQHDEGADGVGQNVAEGDAQVGETERARGLDVLELADGQHARADDARGPRHDRESRWRG